MDIVRTLFRRLERRDGTASDLGHAGGRTRSTRTPPRTRHCASDDEQTSTDEPRSADPAGSSWQLVAEYQTAIHRLDASRSRPRVGRTSHERLCRSSSSSDSDSDVDGGELPDIVRRRGATPAKRRRKKRRSVATRQRPTDRDDRRRQVSRAERIRLAIRQRRSRHDLDEENQRDARATSADIRQQVRAPNWTRTADLHR
jgi:hypothetical protein